MRPNDKQQAQPLLTQVLVMSEQVPRTVSMDAGYFSEANVTALADLGCEPLIPPDRQTHGHALPTAPRGRPPAGLSVAERMRRTFQTKPRTAVVRPTQGDRRAGVWADQAGARLPAVLAARAAPGAWGMGPDLHHPQYTEALAGAPATPRTPRRGATGAEREPDKAERRAKKEPVCRSIRTRASTESAARTRVLSLQCRTGS